MNKILCIFISICLLSATSIAQVPTNRDVSTGNLTDEDKVLMDNYIHTGLQQREGDKATKEVCAAEGYDESKCLSITNGSDATRGEKFLGMSAGMFKAVSMAYTMIIGMGGLGGGMETNDGSEVNDYCRFIALGGEIIATATQKQENDFNLQNPVPPENAQVQNLYKQKKAHKSREKSSSMQATTWGATTVCYTAMMAKEAVSGTAVSNYLKIGSGLLMWGYYDWEQKQHKKAQSAVQAIISKIEAGTGKGDCNPVSERDCYCSQPETASDPKWCMPQIRARIAGDNAYQVTCVDENLKQDIQCRCAEENSCLDKVIREEMATMHIPGSVAKSLTPFMEMTRGSIKPGSGKYYVNTDSNKLFAVSKKYLRDNQDKLNIPKRKLSALQKSMVNEMVGLGLPKSIATGLALAKPSKEAEASAKKFKSALSKRIYRGRRYKRGSSYRTRAPRFSGGKGLGRKSSAQAKQDNMAAMMRKLRGKKGKGLRKNGNVLRFSSAAQRKAAKNSINRDKSANIFKILSQRYQTSARRMLDVKN